MGRLRTRDLLGRKLCRALAGLARHRDQRQSTALGRTPCRPAAAHEFAAVKSHPILKEISESRTANWDLDFRIERHEYTSDAFPNEPNCSLAPHLPRSPPQLQRSIVRTRSDWV